jgi:alpha-1,2-mannosyltransferase
MRRPTWTFWACLVGAGTAVPVVSLVADIMNPHKLGRDFAGFWAAGRLFASGHGAASYDRAALSSVVRQIGDMQAVFVYPPPTLALLAPFGLLPYPLALALWTLLGSALFAYAARRDVHPLLAIATPAALLNVWDGQFGLLFGALWLLFFRTDSGICAGLAALKPQLAVMMLPRLTKRSAIVATLTLAVIALPFAQLWPDFIQASREHADFVARAKGSFFLRMMPGGYGAFGQSWAMHLLFAIPALLLVVRYRAFDCFQLATATFLIVPYAHNYDMTVACVGFARFLSEEWSMLRMWEKGVVATAFLSPALTYFLPVTPVLLAALWVQVRPAAAKASPACNPLPAQSSRESSNSDL